MAYVYPEDRIDDGVVTDPRPLNRTLGHYYGEFNGMLDKDNITRAIIDTTRIVNMNGSQAAATSGMAGPCNQVKSWRTETDQTLLGNSLSGFRLVENLGGNISTQDSGLIVEASGNYIWTNHPATLWQNNFVDFLLTIDGIEIDLTGGMSACWTLHPYYLNGYIPIGSGTHTVYLYVRSYNAVWDYSDHCTYIQPATADITLTRGELIVREVRR